MPSDQTVVFRADASLRIGTGHVMRCMTMASELEKRGVKTSFICRVLPGDLCDYLESNGFSVNRLPASKVSRGRDDDSNNQYAGWLGVDLDEEQAQVEAILSKSMRGVAWLVVDHYALDQRWETRMRPHVGRIMVIDDLANRMHDCDLILDQNLLAPSRYARLVPAHCVQLLGPSYALLRPEFSYYRNVKLKQRGTVARVLILFGGVDPTNETGKALEAVQSVHRDDILVDVVIGSTNPNKSTVEKICASLKYCRCHVQPSNVAELMAAASISIGASGSTMWERLCVGLPAIVITIAQNQEEIASEVAKTGAIRNLGDSARVTSEDVAAALKELLDQPGLVESMSHAAASLVDGAGTGRVVDHLLAYD